MSERDADIEFDFFDEPETEEATQRHPRLPRRPPPRSGGGGPREPRRPSRGGGPRRPVRPAPGVTPLLRLAGLIAFAILIVLLFVFAVRRCSAETKTHEYQSYMTQVRKLSASSDQLGRQLADRLTTPGIKQRALVSDVRGLAQQQTQDLTQARQVIPPGPLRDENGHMLDALQLRAIGLSRLADAFQRTTTTRNPGVAATLLATQARLLTASDVIWSVYFLAPARAELRRQGIGGVDVPGSAFVQNPDFASTRALIPVFERVHSVSTGGKPTGLHGTGLVSVKAVPNACPTCADKETLSPTSQNTVTASTSLAFEVAVQDTGNAQEVQIPVTLTIEKTPQAIVERQVITVINPGETKTVTFNNISSPPFGTPTRLKVDIAPVPAEKTLTNNSATYSVVFSLG